MTRTNPVSAPRRNAVEVLETGSPILDEAPAAAQDAAYVAAVIKELAELESADHLPQAALEELVTDLLEQLDELRAFALRVLA